MALIMSFCIRNSTSFFSHLWDNGSETEIRKIRRKVFCKVL